MAPGDALVFIDRGFAAVSPLPATRLRLRENLNVPAEHSTCECSCFRAHQSQSMQPHSNGWASSG
jgi:hypothetical protein